MAQLQKHPAVEQMLNESLAAHCKHWWESFTASVPKASDWLNKCSMNHCTVHTRQCTVEKCTLAVLSFQRITAHYTDGNLLRLLSQKLQIGCNLYWRPPADAMSTNHCKEKQSIGEYDGKYCLWSIHFMSNSCKGRNHCPCYRRKTLSFNSYHWRQQLLGAELLVVNHKHKNALCSFCFCQFHWQLFVWHNWRTLSIMWSQLYR